MYGDWKWVLINYHLREANHWITIETFFGRHKISNQNLLVGLNMVIKNRFSHRMKGANSNVRKHFMCLF
jgi:hypothetical protein